MSLQKRASVSSGEWELNYKPRPQMIAFHQRDKRFSYLICHRRFGKALDVATPILTQNRGWQTMGSLMTGDVVFDENGCPTNVVQAHDVLHNRQCYNVEFSDGSSIVADAEHLWHTQTKLDRAHTVRTPEGRIKQPKHGTVKTTLEISQTLLARGEANHSIPVAAPLQYPPAELLLDPYVLGVWLGDGTSRCPHITTEDAQILHRVTQYAQKNGLSVQALASSNAGNAVTYSITHPLGEGHKANSLTRKLKALKVWKNKHIPPMYKRASISQRLELLRGLMDTDGSVNKSGTAIEITLKNEALLNGVEELMRGLGFKPVKSVKTVNGVPYFRLSTPPSALNPFSLLRKANRLGDPPPPAKASQKRFIVAVTPVLSRPVRCITVDSPSRLYLAGRGLIPTHNTVACVAELIIRALYTTKKQAQYAYVCPFRSQAKAVAWNYLVSMTDGIATEVRVSDLSITLPNGAKIFLTGSDNVNALRGLYLDGCVIDEFAQCRPDLLQAVVMPCLLDRRGWLVIIGTAYGRLNQFYEYYEKSRTSDDWFHADIKVTESGVIPPDEIERIQRSISTAKFNQEFMNDFSAELVGTYYANIINQLEAQGRITKDTLYDPELPVSASLDIGRGDSTVIWFWQERPDGFAVIDHYANNGEGADHYIKLLNDKPYQFERIWLPHDARAKTFATKKSALEQFMEAKLPVSIVPRLSVEDGIEATRQVLPLCYFDYDTCYEGVEALRIYRKKWDGLNQVFSKDPLHDQSSDHSDSFRYMAIVCRQRRKLPPAPLTTPEASRYGDYSLEALYSEREKMRPKGVAKLRI